MSATLTACPDTPGETTETTGNDTSTGTDTGDSTDTTSTGGSTDAPTTDPTTTTDDSTSTTGEPELSRIEKILAALGVAMYECPERVWPDVQDSYRARQVLLASVLENRAWLWNDQVSQAEPPAVSDGPLDGLPPEWTASFNVGVLQNVQTLGISLDETAAQNEAIASAGLEVWPDAAISLAFHEGFHFLSAQDDWNVGNGSRTAPYPEPWQPRYLRAALLTALLAAVQGDADALPAAAYWQAQLQAEFAEELQAGRRYECTEGSAEYASLMMSALAELGCEASDAELLALARERADDGLFLGIAGYNPGREFYDLGVLAGLLLREQQVPGWELEVEDGTPPVELALAGVTPASQPDDPALQASVQSVVDARNASLATLIEPMLEHMQSAEYTRIPVSYGWIAGSFQVGGFYYLAEDPAEPEVLLSFSAELDPPSGVAISVQQLTALTGVTTPCALPAGNSIVLTIPTADLEVAADKATATNARLKFSGLEVEATTDIGGLPWLCPVDGGGAGNAPPAEPNPVLDELRARSNAPHHPLRRLTDANG
ncbi:hypothetical protein [Nannocystis punicea]|uniref:Lipoprotein n=1 Tax=Nannocystis punicea TaxID=2995304 RepID=A0ABY7H0J1_9BACT|nr:hypothetical protein [Nannocystis poenicansa]WAS92620.1 hypothetical protein O0S08_41100 [Nannocystis poenicansa]